MGSLTCAFRLSLIAGGDVANAITPAETSTAPPQSEAPALGASALARSVADSTIAANRIAGGRSLVDAKRRSFDRADSGDASATPDASKFAFVRERTSSLAGREVSI